MMGSLDSLCPVVLDHLIRLVWQNTLFLTGLLIALGLFHRTPAKMRYAIVRIAAIKLAIPVLLPIQPVLRLFSPTSAEGWLEAILVFPSVKSSAALTNPIWLLLPLWAFVTTVLWLAPILRTRRLIAQTRAGRPVGEFRGIPVVRFRKNFLPYAVGFFTPRIVVPRQWNEWSANQHRLILQHEWVHIRRGDVWMRLVLAWVQALYFFHPLVRLFNRSFLDILEQSCDEETLALLPLSPLDYSRALILVTESSLDISNPGALALPLLYRASALGRRITHLLQTQLSAPAKTWSGLLMWSGLIVGIAVFSISHPQKLPESFAASASSAMHRSLVAYDQAPYPHGGFAELQRSLNYPESARRSGLEGDVILSAEIDERGQTGRVAVLQSSGHAEFDHAAREAIRSVTWVPAQSMGKPVRVEVAVPIRFRLE
ncbi:MAG TPA: M56 family metallopeptidase [bacterium]|nr:M56 family metallopeptidase [bacterium]